MTRAWVLLLGIVCGGCAAGLTPPVLGATASSGAAPCVPPDMAHLGAWRPGPAENVAVEDEDGRVFSAVRRAYRLPDGSLAIGLWVDGWMVLVDPAPDDRSVPAWSDRGALAPGRNVALRRDRHSRTPCQWQKSGGAEA